jgi:hypothetical protein
MDLTCPEECFQAASSDECFYHLKAQCGSGFAYPKLTVSSTIDILCRTDFDQSKMHNLSILNMFILIKGELMISVGYRQAFLTRNSYT